MARKVRQDIAGYNVALASLGVEYTRALENTTRSKEEHEGVLDRIQWLLDLYRREQRAMLSQARTDGFRAPQQQRAGSGTTRAKRERGASRGPERRATAR